MVVTQQKTKAENLSLYISLSQNIKVKDYLIIANIKMMLILYNANIVHFNKNSVTPFPFADEVNKTLSIIAILQVTLFLFVYTLMLCATVRVIADVLFT